MKYNLNLKAWVSKIKTFTEGSFFQAGLPFIGWWSQALDGGLCIIKYVKEGFIDVFMLGGVYVLTYVQEVRIQYRDKSNIMVSIKELEEATGRKRKQKAKTINDAYKESPKNDLDDWENIRGPRPWEDSKAVQDEQRAKLREKTS